jgi:transposase
MNLSDFDLRQLADRDLSGLSAAEKDRLLGRLLGDLIEARERLKANSRTSSRPPSSDPPWSGADGEEEETAEECERRPSEGREDSVDAEEPERLPPDEGRAGKAKLDKKKPGRRLGTAGHSRSVTLPLTATVLHVPPECALCGAGLPEERFAARTGLYVLDLEVERGEGLLGLQVSHRKHLYGDGGPCGCGHVTRSEPGRCPDEERWGVGLTEWHLVGPNLASLIVCLALRMRQSRRGTQEFLRDWFGIELSTSTINQCLHEAGRAVEPLEESLAEEVRAAVLAHADETTWKEAGQLLWLWVVATATVSLYLVGYRTAELITAVLGEGFDGWLMSDGYRVYRQFRKRLRCRAHLQRKAKGLKDSLGREARAFGDACDALLGELMAAIYAARENPPPAGALAEACRSRLEEFRALCERHRESPHGKTRALARGFLNDREAVWIVLAHPHLPLTNNEAGRALRHWVILRRISNGTRTEQGSRALALLASVIETCRKRNHLPWPYLAQVIAERRKGNIAPPLPAPA